MVLELYDATLRRGGREVFSGLSFLVSPGERVAVTGGSAVDRTLVLQTFLGLCRLDSGYVCFDGEPMQPETAACFRKSVACLSRDFDFGSMTVEEVARAMCGERVNKGVKYSADDVRRSLERLEVAGDSLAKSFDCLGAATAQRTLMALTFMFRRRAALADSPTQWQDERGRAAVAEYLASSRFDDVSVVVATDDRRVLDVCSKVVSLDNETSIKQIRI